MQFYAAMLYVRESVPDMPEPRTGTVRFIDDNTCNDNKWFFRGGRLFQQFVCSAAARYDLKRMSTLATPRMQTQLRAETYSQLIGALRDGQPPANIGKRIICPSSVKGSRRAMYKLFLDCMAIVRVFGAPHLFITVTCNQGHRHIIASVLGGQRSDERADIVNRFFAKQIDQLLKCIDEGKAFGELTAYCYVIEYQKRGNPHIHMVVRLLHGPNSPEEYDKYVSARLPPGPPRGEPGTNSCSEAGCCCRKGHPPLECGCEANGDANKPCTCDSVLWHAVLQHMVHVCGDDAPCRGDDGKCRYGYDEENFTPVTLHAAKRRPQYKRIAPSEGGRYAHKQVKGPGGVAMEVNITDAKVVPHSPRLLLAPVGYEFDPKALDIKDDAVLAKTIRDTLKRGSHRDAWHANVEISR